MLDRLKTLLDGVGSGLTGSIHPCNIIKYRLRIVLGDFEHLKAVLIWTILNGVSLVQPSLPTSNIFEGTCWVHLNTLKLL